MATLSIQIKGPAVSLRSSSLSEDTWERCREKIGLKGSGGWYGLLEDDFFLGMDAVTRSGKAILHWQDLDDDLYLLGAIPARRTIMRIKHSAKRKSFHKTLNQLLEHGMLFPLFHNSIRSIAFDPDNEHNVAIAESRVGPLFTFTWDVPDLELFNPEALEFCWVKVNLYGKREFLLFTDILYKKMPAKEIKTGKTVVKSWELIRK
ncbi:MAG TPA: hypothetical protein DIS90_02955 [Cytophagales bacterium]|nr:hypothetical protein [Cytophagales bacterium]HRE98584.1 hypothetical protein [Flavobacteriales bacterium]HRJ36862.1 hypothetical protein [Flavobacteriales bacterium]HRJ40102.1 hypothetical protein [Flavobacteriales bacterium]